MIKASHRLSEGCEFDPHLGLRNRFSEDRAWRTFIYHWRSPRPTFIKYMSQLSVYLKQFSCFNYKYLTGDRRFTTPLATSAIETGVVIYLFISLFTWSIVHNLYHASTNLHYFLPSPSILWPEIEEMDSVFPTLSYLGNRDSNVSFIVHNTMDLREISD